MQRLQLNVELFKVSGDFGFGNTMGKNLDGHGGEALLLSEGTSSAGDGFRLTVDTVMHHEAVPFRRVYAMALVITGEGTCTRAALP